MGTTWCNRKTIMKGSGRYHEIGWNVKIASASFTTVGKATIAGIVTAS
jgi:hypothetical protein